MSKCFSECFFLYLYSLLTNVIYVSVVEKGEITWDNDEDFEVEQIIDYVEEDVIINYFTSTFFILFISYVICIGIIGTTIHT